MTVLQRERPAVPAGRVRGEIFNIQRFCTHDGPGIRTTVFLKGCPLRCLWCHNPEGLERGREIAYAPDKCIGCRACLAACGQGAHQFLDSGAHLWHPERCVRCGACVEVCFAEALESIGEEKTAREVVEVVLRDEPFYDNSGGGVTLSGGEPFFQPAFSAALLELCREEGISTAVETSCAVSWPLLESFLPLVDEWMCDVKAIDARRHRELTGLDNRRILDNLRRLCGKGASVLIRFPLVPGLNDQREELCALGDFVRRIRPRNGLEIMPYHRIGQGKYERMNRSYTLEDLPEADDDQVRRAARILRERGVDPVFCQRLPDL